MVASIINKSESSAALSLSGDFGQVYKPLCICII